MSELTLVDELSLDPGRAALVIQDMHLRRLQRDIQPNILAHDSSPRMALLYQLQLLPDLHRTAAAVFNLSFCMRELAGSV